MQEINDELMMPCAQCCRKHLSAAIAYWTDIMESPATAVSCENTPRILLARALINLCEATEGYASHFVFARGLLVMAEEVSENPINRIAIRNFRSAVDKGEWPAPPLPLSAADMYNAHMREAVREYPEVDSAVDFSAFVRDNMSEPELRQAEVNYRLAQLRWLDENVFGYQPKEKGEEEMAKSVKKPAAPAKKGGCKGACKGGKSKK